jgi:hypothetical protein
MHIYIRVFNIYIYIYVYIYICIYIYIYMYIYIYIYINMYMYMYVGKSSTDTALIIDAMDLLHQKLVTNFCIVSSDSDYTGKWI